MQTPQAAQQIVAGVEQQAIGLDQSAVEMNDINQAAQSAVGDLPQLVEQLKSAVAQYRV